MISFYRFVSPLDLLNNNDAASEVAELWNGAIRLILVTQARLLSSTKKALIRRVQTSSHGSLLLRSGVPFTLIREVETLVLAKFALSLDDLSFLSFYAELLGVKLVVDWLYTLLNCQTINLLAFDARNFSISWVPLLADNRHLFLLVQRAATRIGQNLCLLI